jgi:hypothetical protein
MTDGIPTVCMTADERLLSDAESDEADHDE